MSYCPSEEGRQQQTRKVESRARSPARKGSPLLSAKGSSNCMSPHRAWSPSVSPSVLRVPREAGNTPGAASVVVKVNGASLFRWMTQTIHVKNVSICGLNGAHAQEKMQERALASE